MFKALLENFVESMCNIYISHFRNTRQIFEGQILVNLEAERTQTIVQYRLLRRLQSSRFTNPCSV